MSIIRSNRFLWVLQALLAALFVFAGTAKLMMDPVELAAQSHMSATFLHFISVCELLGAIGLIVPLLTGIAPKLTPLAAGGLIVIMVGATVLTVQQQPLITALFPLMTGVLLAIVLYGRLRPTVRA
jgi:uncharacterized membrane protein YphA (DoxX/SURF4 family)